MGRRAKADLYNLIDRIIHMYHEEKKDIRTIASILKAEGYDISKSSIHRTLKNYADAAKEFQEIYEETRALIETLKEKPASDVVEGLMKIVVNRVFRFAKDIESMEFDDAYEFISAVEKLAKTIEKLEKYKTEKTKQILEKAEKESLSKEELLKMLREVYGA